MSTPLVIEHFDVVEQLHLGIPVTFETLPKLALHRREEALHDRVVVAVAAPTHAARDAVLPEHCLIVLARVGASLVRVVQQAGIGATPLQRHLERFDRQVPVVDGADRPAHDEAREQVKNRGQVELAAGPDQQLRRVAYPTLVGRLRLELAVQEVCSDRLVVLAQGRHLESLARSCFQSVFLHRWCPDFCGKCEWRILPVTLSKKVPAAKRDREGYAVRKPTMKAAPKDESWDDPLLVEIRPVVREAIEDALEKELNRALGAR